MILDTLPNASLYRSLSPRLNLGFDWLAAFDPRTPEGRYDIDGDNVFALVQGYETGAPSGKKLESHRTYLDIQYVVSGAETIYYAPLAGLAPATEHDAAKDIRFYAEPPDSTALKLQPGCFAVFYPNDAHKPGCVNGASCRVRKIVVKVRV